MLKSSRFLALATASLAVALIVWAVALSPAFKKCMGERDQDDRTQESEKHSPYALMPLVNISALYSRCFGAVIDENNGTITAIFTVVLAISTTMLWSATRQLYKISAADTRTIQRAYVAVVPKGINPYRADKTQFSVDFAIVNAGNLPAQKLYWQFTTAFSTERWRKTFCPPSGEVGGGVIIPARGEMIKSAPPIQTEALYRFLVENPDKTTKCYLYVWGFITYHDGFNPERRTEFCHRYNINDFGPDGIASHYGRQHEHGNHTDESKKNAGLSEPS